MSLECAQWRSGHGTEQSSVTHQAMLCSEASRCCCVPRCHFCPAAVLCGKHHLFSFRKRMSFDWTHSQSEFFFFLFFRADVVCVQDVQEMSEYKAQFRVELRLQSESFEFDCVLVTWSVHRRLQVNNVLKSLLNAALQHFTDLQPVELRLVAGEKKQYWNGLNKCVFII